MKETRILCDMCGKVINSESPDQFTLEAYLYASEHIHEKEPTVLRATVCIKQTGVDDPFTYDVCEACIRETIKVGRCGE